MEDPAKKAVEIASCTVATLSELKSKVGEENFKFPAIAIPFGGEEGDECRHFSSFVDISPEDFESLHTDSHAMPADGVRRVHFITRLPTGEADFSPRDGRFELFVARDMAPLPL